MRGVKTIALSKRIYEDEAPIYVNEASAQRSFSRGKTHHSTKVALRDQVHTARLRKERSRAALGTCQAKTQTLRRSNASQWMQQHR